MTYTTPEAAIRDPVQFAGESSPPGAQLDTAHVGDIRGGLGTILQHDVGPREGWWARLKTLLAILGPGLIVMVGDNDAGAFGTYTQAGQNYGTTPGTPLGLLTNAVQTLAAVLLPCSSAAVSSRCR